MFKNVVDGFKRWMTCDEVYSVLESTSKTYDALCAEFKSLNSRVSQLEAAEKSCGEALEFIVSSTEEIKPVCDDCVSMRLELDAVKLRLEALEATGKSNGGRRTKNTQTSTASDSKPKRVRKKSNAKKLAS